MSIDLGNNPIGTPPSEGEKAQIRRITGALGPDVVLPGPYLNSADALASGVSLGESFYDLDGKLQLATPSTQRICFAGDSLFSPYITAATTQTILAVHSMVEAYGAGRLKVVRPTGRNAFVHAVGGTDVGEFQTGQLWGGSTVYQKAEIISQAAEIDIVVLMLGANDFKRLAYDLVPTLNQLEQHVTDLNTAGLMVVLMTANPGDSTVYNGRVYSDMVREWNAALKQRFANFAGVVVFDTAGELGQRGNLGLTKDFYLGDGTHYSGLSIDMVSFRLARFLLGRLNPSDSAKSWRDEGPMINVNPLLKSGLGDLQLIPSSQMVSSSEYAARANGESGERTFDVSLDISSQSLGSGDSEIIYTIANGQRIFVIQFARTGTSNSSLKISLSDPNPETGVRLLTIDPVRVNTTIDNSMTATAVANAVNNDPALSGLVTAAAQGTGLGNIAVSSTRSAEVRTNFSNSDAVSVSNGDFVRAVLEWEPIEGEECSIYPLQVFLRPSAGTGSGTNIAAGLIQTFASAMVLNKTLGRPMLIATPWVEVTGGQAKFAIRAYLTGWGKIRLSRVGIQKRG